MDSKSSTRHNLPRIPTRDQNTRYAVSKASSKDQKSSPGKPATASNVSLVSAAEITEPDDVKTTEMTGSSSNNVVKEENATKADVNSNSTKGAAQAKSNKSKKSKSPKVEQSLSENPKVTENLPEILPPTDNPPELSLPPEIPPVSAPFPPTSPPVKLHIKMSSPDSHPQIVRDTSQVMPADVTTPENKRKKARTKRELKKQLMERRAQISQTPGPPSSEGVPDITNPPPTMSAESKVVTSPVITSPVITSPVTSPGVRPGTSGDGSKTKFVLGDMLWGKVSGHPWWPCIVANDPFTGEFNKQVNKTRKYHVQFFGQEDERGWCAEASLMLYEGREAFTQFCDIMIEKDRKNKKLYEIQSRRRKAWDIAVKAAEESATLTYEQRVDLFRLDYVPTEAPVPAATDAVVGESIDAQPQKRGRTEEASGSSPPAKRSRRSSSARVIDEEPAYIKLPENVENQKSARYTVFCMRKRDVLKRQHPGYTAEQIDALLLKEWNELSEEKQSMFIPMGSDFAKLSEIMTKNMAQEAQKSPTRKKTPRSSKKRQSKDGQEGRKRKKSTGASSESKHTEAAADTPALTAEEDIIALIDQVAKGSGTLPEIPEVKLPTPVDSKDTDDTQSESDVESIKTPSEPLPYDLELRYLFSAGPTKKEAVCELCEGEGELVQCDGGCYASFHPACLKLDTVPTEYKCPECISGVHKCFACKESSSDTERCSVNHCGRYYHVRCVKDDLNARVEGGTITCPLHTCATCAVDNPKNVRARQGRFLRCVRCPTAYHSGEFCIAAGSKTLAGYNIVCSNHFEPNKNHSYHTIHHVCWCFVCSKGGTLVCCDTCPAAFHVECLETTPPDGPWQCNPCADGRRPLYGDVIWIKLGHYRWWPAEICHPKNVPHNIQNMPHKIGEFPVKFLGSHDYYWTHQGRVFLYQEGDRGGSGENSGPKSLAKLFKKALHEASLAYRCARKFREEKEERDNQRSERKPPSYKHIKCNFAVGSVQINKADRDDLSKCSCTPDKPCGEDSECLNRMTLYECHPQVCPAAEACQNQRFQKRLYPKSSPFRTEGRGWGLKCQEDIKKGQFVNEYVGDLIDPEECDRRIKEAHENDVTSFYMLTLDSKRIIDAGPKGNLSRFINHSCTPNLVTQVWTVNGDQRVGFFAIHDIPTGTELTFNYNLKCLGNEKTVCRCDSVNCSGFIGVRPKSSVGELDRKDKKSKKKKRRGIKKVHADECYRCGDGGELILCDQFNCPKAYHLKCLKLQTKPKGSWLCPWHHCDECGQRALKLCSECPNSFCPRHLEGNIYSLPGSKLVCSEHTDLIEAASASTPLTSLENQPDAIVPSFSDTSTGSSEETSSGPPSPGNKLLPLKVSVPPPASDTESSSTDSSKPRRKSRKTPVKRKTVKEVEVEAVAPVMDIFDDKSGNSTDSSSEGRLTIVVEETETKPSRRGKVTDAGTKQRAQSKKQETPKSGKRKPAKVEKRSARKSRGSSELSDDSGELVMDV